MKRVCLDTHVLIWHLASPKRVGRTATRLLRDVDAGRAEALIPAIVVVELSLLREAGRRVVGPVEVEALTAAQPGFRVLPLDAEQGREFALLSSLRDPYDRLVVAAARCADAVLLTADDAITRSSLVDVAWD